MEDVDYWMKHPLEIKRPPEARLKGCGPWNTHWSLSSIPPLNHGYKTPHQIPADWGTQFLRGMSPLCLPLPGKAIKLFFSILTRTLSLRFNSAWVHRGWVFSIGVVTWFSSVQCHIKGNEVFNFGVLTLIWRWMGWDGESWRHCLWSKMKHIC